jgi:probable F420-dependent oxidoreductase
VSVITEHDVVGDARERLGSVGVWLGALLGVTADVERPAARRIEELGFGSIFVGERIGGKEAMAHQAVLLAATDHIVMGTGIANVWSRHPAAMQGGAATLGDAYPGRFVLGVGVSHAVMVDNSGLAYEKPLAHMARYLDDMAASAPLGPEPRVPVPHLLAALRPRMLELARTSTDGAHPYFVPPSHTPLAREVLGPDKLLVPEQAVVLASDPDTARRVARQHMSTYLGLPNYVNNLRHLGFTDDDLADGGSDRLVDAIVAWGDETAIATRVTEHLDGGADHVLLQPLGDLDRAMAQLEVLAPALLGT